MSFQGVGPEDLKERGLKLVLQDCETSSLVILCCAAWWAAAPGVDPVTNVWLCAGVWDCDIPSQRFAFSSQKKTGPSGHLLSSSVRQFFHCWHPSSLDGFPDDVIRMTDAVVWEHSCSRTVHAIHVHLLAFRIHRCVVHRLCNQVGEPLLPWWPHLIASVWLLLLAVHGASQHSGEKMLQEVWLCPHTDNSCQKECSMVCSNQSIPGLLYVLNFFHRFGWSGQASPQSLNGLNRSVY